MQSSWVIKLPQADLPEQPILIHVTKKAGHELNVDLLATDGDTAYRGKLRERNYTKFRSANYDGTDKQWASILKYTFISKTSSGISDLDRQNLGVDCAVSTELGKTQLAIVLVTRIEDIVHRLGAVELAFSEDVSDVDLFGWSCQIIDQRDEHEQQSTRKAAEIQSTQDVLAALRKQLDDLIKAKEDHEDQLLEKFSLLLNEKKLKIRTQQRVLKTAKVDPKKLAAMQRKTNSQQNIESTNKRRREATDDADTEDGSTDDQEPNVNDDQEMLDVDSADDARTTDTATEDGDEIEESPRHGVSADKPSTAQGLTAPPTRPLPFQKTDAGISKSSKPTATPTIGDDEETASEDDEL